MLGSRSVRAQHSIIIFRSISDLTLRVCLYSMFRCIQIHMKYDRYGRFDRWFFILVGVCLFFGFIQIKHHCDECDTNDLNVYAAQA